MKTKTWELWTVSLMERKGPVSSAAHTNVSLLHKTCKKIVMSMTLHEER